MFSPVLGGGLVACEEVGSHTHSWGEWQVLDGNKPTASAVGKATRVCSGAGECNAEQSDKEYELPALNSEDYSKSADTATCAQAGQVVYTYNKNNVNVSFEVATEINPQAHSYGEYVNTDAEGHYKICSHNSEHKTEPQSHDSNGTDGACSVCGYKAPAPAHVHNAGEWVNSDPEQHYKLCSDADCPSPNDKLQASSHNSDGTDGACSVCGYKAPAPAHTHSWGEWQVSDGNKPTASAVGKATRVCSGAGECNAEQSDKEYELPALNSEDYSKSADTATCAQAGQVVYTYNKNNVNVSFEVATEINPQAHGELTPHDAVGKTCETDGAEAYWECSECHKLFSDNKAENSIDKPVAIPASHGELAHHDAVDKTCEANGNVEYWSCPDCSAKFSDAQGQQSLQSEVIPASHGELTPHDAVGKTCETDGAEAYWECSECHKLFSDNKAENSIDKPVAIPASHGELAHHDAVIATCTSTGVAEYYQCLVCEKNFADAEAKQELENIVTPMHPNAVEANLSSSKSLVTLPLSNGSPYTYPCSKIVGVYQCPDCNDDKYFYGALRQNVAYNPYYSAQLGILLVSDTTASLEKVTQNFAVAFQAPKSGSYKIVLSNGKNAQGESAQATIYNLGCIIENKSYRGVGVISRGAFSTSGELYGRFVNLQNNPTEVEVKLREGEIIFFTAMNIVSADISVESTYNELVYGEQSISVTEADVSGSLSWDSYYYIPSVSGVQSITVPAGIVVELNGNTLVDASASDGPLSANFEATAGEPLLFTFLSATVGDYSVTIGDEILQIITPDEPVSNLSVPAKGVAVVEVGDIEEGRYRLTIRLTNTLMRSMVYFGKNINPNFEEIFGPSNQNGMGGSAEVIYQNMQAQLRNSELDYEVSFSNLVITIELDLQQGDKLVFAHSNPVDGPVDLAIVKI